MDIVERLREHNEPPFDYIAHEAADEIEQLRLANSDLQMHYDYARSGYDYARTECDKLQAEVLKLREELNEKEKE